MTTPLLSDNKAVATQSNRPKTLREWLSADDFKKQVALALPKHLSPDRMLRIALTTVLRNPKLEECDPRSVLQAVLTCSQFGLEPDGRRAHLIPFQNRQANRVDCQLIFDYKGLVELVRRSGDVSFIHADVVRAGDTFDYLYGTGGYLKHKPLLASGRGDVIAAYSYVRLKDGTEDFDIMSVEDLDAIRKRSKSPDSGPWKTDTAEMQKKTVFRRHSKWLPLSPEVAEAISSDDDGLVPAATERERFEVAKPIFSAMPERDAEPPEQEAPPVTAEEKKTAPSRPRGSRHRSSETVVEPIDGVPTNRELLTQRIKDEDLDMVKVEQVLFDHGLITAAQSINNLSEDQATQVLAEIDNLIKQVRS